MHKIIIEAIEKLGGQPFIWELEDVTNLSSTVLKSQLKDYPEKLLISKNEKNILENYNSTITMKELSEIVGLTPNTCRKIVISLSRRNLLEYAIKKFETSDTQATYIEVLTNRLLPIKIKSVKQNSNFKGTRGFIIDIKHNYTICQVYKDTMPYKVKLLIDEYKIIGA